LLSVTVRNLIIRKKARVVLNMYKIKIMKQNNIWTFYVLSKHIFDNENNFQAIITLLLFWK